ncbi:hypothetical protein [Calidithermus chliarophilus]|uniref:hypothetical protein n=1 Tax=Calidithermus chliarophilus TaxID=52023 RepID=UPI0004293C11|nr:hypothetical protein [Calidithermus chliarophilus]
MKSLKIRVYKNGSEPETTVTIPGSVLRLASRLIPRRAQEAMRAEGIDMNELVQLAEQPEVQGTLIEVEEHAKGERVVIALE